MAEAEPLPPYDHDALCPKCRFMPGTTEYHDGYHGAPCSFPDAAWLSVRSSLPAWYPTRDLYPDPVDYQREVDLITERNAEARAIEGAIPEHFDRTCPNCKHLWAEAPIHG